MGIARNFQQVRLFPALSVIRISPWSAPLAVCRGNRLEHAARFGLFELGYRRQERTGHAKAMLELVEYHGAARTAALQQLTLVDQRRLEIARALASDPRLLLLDEPAAGMNPHGATRAFRDSSRRSAGSAVTVLLVEHNIRLVIDHRRPGHRAQRRPDHRFERGRRGYPERPSRDRRLSRETAMSLPRDRRPVACAYGNVHRAGQTFRSPSRRARWLPSSAPTAQARAR